MTYDKMVYNNTIGLLNKHGVYENNDKGQIRTMQDNRMLNTIIIQSRFE